MAELRHQHLRRLYRARGLTMDDLARATGQCKNSVALKLGGVYPWSIDDIWSLCDLLRIEPRNIGHYFPRHGLDRLAPRIIGRTATTEDDIARKLLDAIRLAMKDEIEDDEDLIETAVFGTN